MSGIKSFVGKSLKKTVKFMDENLEIKKLSVAEVLEIQNLAKDAGADEEANFDILKKIVRLAADGGNEMDDGDFDAFPIDDLSKLSTEIMKYSGMDTKAAGKEK